MKTPSKILAIGLDGADWRTINRLIDQGDLPNLKKVIGSGVSANLRSTVPAMTPLAWTSIVTGCNPGRHGIYDFISVGHEDYKPRPVDFRTLHRPTLMEIFTHHGKKSIIVNFPLGYPPLEIDGIFISGIPTPEGQDIVYPPARMDEIRKNGFKILPDIKYTDGQKNYSEAIIALTKKQVDLTCEFLRDEEWDLAWLVLMGLDWAQHYLWEETGSDLVDNLYRVVDEQIGKLLEFATPEIPVLILSDHGGHRVEGEIFTNNLLEAWGFLKRTDPSQKTHSVKGLRKEILHAGRRVFRKLPVATKSFLRKNASKKYVSKLRADSNASSALHNQVDWDATSAFGFGAMGRIFINTKDRFRSGPVESVSAYLQIRDQIKSKLLALRHPVNHDKLIEKVYFKDKLYHGAQLKDAPDILFTTVDDRYSVYSNFEEKWFLPPGIRKGDHYRDGIFILSGPGIGENKNIQAIDVEDITPTILGLLDLPIPDDLDGTFVIEILKEGTQKQLKYEPLDFSAVPRRKTQSTESPISEEIEDRLKDLGYL